MRNFKRVLITGINGSGGSYLAEHILNKKKKLKIFGTHRSNNLKNIEKIKNKISITQCDLNNFFKLKKILKKIKPDVIFHLASDADVRKSFDEPKKIMDFFFPNFFSFKNILINFTKFLDGQIFAGQFAEAPIAIEFFNFKKSLEIFFISFFKTGIEGKGKFFIFIKRASSSDLWIFWLIDL